MTEATGSVAAAGGGRLAEVIALRGGEAAPETPFVIEHREALIYMLYEAAELEHGIMCQYLFAAFSLKQREDEGLTADALEAVLRWRRVIAHVATEEMLHLALVQNLLSAIGSAPHLARPNLPAPARHYPAGVNLTLVPFGEPALRHFMFLERPEGMELEGAEGIDAPVHEAVPLMAEGDIVPQPQDFATLGHLYRSIEHGIDHLAENSASGTCSSARRERRRRATTSTGPSSSRSPTSRRPTGQSTRSSSRAKGRGCVAERALRPVRPDPRRIPRAEGGESGLRAGTTGPLRDRAPVRARRHRASDHRRRGIALHRPVQRRLRDSHQLLHRYFAHTEETDAQLTTLSRAAIALMFRVLKPLGDLITTLPVGQSTRG